jgi:hypothetical protein
VLDPCNDTNICGLGVVGRDGAPATITTSAAIMTPAPTVLDPCKVDDGADDDLCSTQSLMASQRLFSRNRVYHVEMQLDGNLVLYRHNDRGETGRTPQWATHTVGRGATMAVMQEDGNLVLCVDNSCTMPIWSTMTSDQPGNWLRLHDDGNLVMYSADGRTRRWKSRTGPCDESHGDTLCSEGRLLGGRKLTSPNKLYHLEMQLDGNMVLYRQCRSDDPASRTTLWQTWTGRRDVNSDPSSHPKAEAVMRWNGALVVVNSSTGALLWSSGTGGQNENYLRLQDDGNLILFMKDSINPRWSTGTFDNGGC